MSSVDLARLRRVQAQADCLYPTAAVEAALDRMAAAIRGRLAGSDPTLICVLQGGVVTLGKLLTRLDFPLQIDYVHATRYRGDTRGGELLWKARPSTPLEGRTVIVVDDILDHGITLAGILEYCRAQRAAAVYSAVLVDKQRAGARALAAADFTGLSVPDRYVFGYGMDYHGYLRNAAGIFAVSPEYE